MAYVHLPIRDSENEHLVVNWACTITYIEYLAGVFKDTFFQEVAIKSDVRSDFVMFLEYIATSKPAVLFLCLAKILDECLFSQEMPSGNKFVEYLVKLWNVSTLIFRLVKMGIVYIPNYDIFN